MSEDHKSVDFNGKDNCLSSFNMFNIMRRDKLLCDIVLVVDNVETSAHKIVLASRSKYLHEHFLENDEKIFVIQTNGKFFYNTFKLLIDYIYTSKITINHSNIQELLFASYLLIIEEVLQECMKFVLENKINIDSFIEFENCSSQLKTLFFPFVLSNFVYMTQYQSFSKFPFDLIMMIVRSDDLCTSEIMVYESTLKWIKYNYEERSKYLPKLMKFIRFNSMPLDYLNNHVQNDPIITSNVKCMNYLCEAYKILLNKNAGKDISSTFSYKPKKFNKKGLPNLKKLEFKGVEDKIVENAMLTKDTQSAELTTSPDDIQLLVVLQYSHTRALEMFNISNDTMCVPTLTWFNDLSNCIILNDGRLFALKNENQTYPSYDSFSRKYWTNLNTNKLKSRAMIFSGPIKKWINTGYSHFVHEFHSFNVGIVQFDDHVYVMSSAGIEYYDIEQNSWYAVDSMLSICRDNVKLAVVKNLIYVITDDLSYSYNPATTVGKSICPLQFTDTGYALCVLNDQLYAIGGGNFTRNDTCIPVGDVFKYVPKGNYWMTIASLNIPRVDCAAVEINGLIYAIGGHCCDTIEYYDPKTAVWTIADTALDSNDHLKTNSFLINTKAYSYPEDIPCYFSID